MKLLAGGKPPTLIGKRLGRDERTVEKYINEGTASILEQFNTPRLPQTFARYATFYMDAIDQLGQTIDDIRRDRSPRKQWGAAVSAVKARTDLYDKLVDRGMDYGIIDTRQQRADLQGNVKDIKARLDENIKTLMILRKRIDETDAGFTTRQRSKLLKTDDRVRKIKKVKQDMLGIINMSDQAKYPQDLQNTRQDASDLFGPESPMSDNDKLIMVQETKRKLEIAIADTPPAKEEKETQDSNTVIDAEYAVTPQIDGTPTYLVPPKRKI
jgi:hypothetical protein